MRLSYSEMDASVIDQVAPDGNADPRTEFRDEDEKRREIFLDEPCIRSSLDVFILTLDKNIWNKKTL